MSEREQPRKSSKKKARRSSNKASPSAKVRRNSKTSKERRSSTTGRRGSNKGSPTSKARRSSTKGSKKKSKDSNSPSLSASSKKKTTGKSSPKTKRKVHNDLNKSEDTKSKESKRSQNNVTEKASVLIPKDVASKTDIKTKIIPVTTAATTSTAGPILRTPRPNSTRGRKDRMALIRMNMKKTNLALAEKRKTKFQSGIGRKIDPYNTSNLRISVIQGRNNQLDQRNKYARYSEVKPDTKSLPSLRNGSLAISDGRKMQMSRSSGLSIINSIPQSDNNFGQSSVGNEPEETIDKRLLESAQPATTLHGSDDGAGIRKASLAVVSDRRRANQEALDVNKKLDEHRQRQSRTHDLIKKNLQTL